MILPEHLSKKNQKIMDRYGLPHQLTKLTEECAELIQAACKYMDVPEEQFSEAERNLKLEMADVAILMDQIMTRTGMTWEEFEHMAGYKISRTIGRMAK